MLSQILVFGKGKENMYGSFSSKYKYLELNEKE
jgi:hypothetical protein